MFTPIFAGDWGNTMNTLLFKGYGAHIEFDEGDRIFVGHLAGIRDIVGFHGSSVDELEAAFHESVDDYLAHCAKLGLPANKPFSGRMLLRVPPEVHAQASIRVLSSKPLTPKFDPWLRRMRYWPCLRPVFNVLVLKCASSPRGIYIVSYYYYSV